MPDGFRDVAVLNRPAPIDNRATADPECLWYIPNQVEPGHRGDTIVEAVVPLDDRIAPVTRFDLVGNVP